MLTTIKGNNKTICRLWS